VPVDGNGLLHAAVDGAWCHLCQLSGYEKCCFHRPALEVGVRIGCF
jgi:hypothetical protein